MWEQVMLHPSLQNTNAGGFPSNVQGQSAVPMSAPTARNDLPRLLEITKR
jgi:hypothetical protein